MERYLIVDSQRPWVDREAIKPGDHVIASHEPTGEEYKVIFDRDVWYVEHHEATKVHDFKDLFLTFRKGWKFFKLVEKRIQ